MLARGHGDKRLREGACWHGGMGTWGETALKGGSIGRPDN
jgi:hypothetical protein